MIDMKINKLDQNFNITFTLVCRPWITSGLIQDNRNTATCRINSDFGKNTVSLKWDEKISMSRLLSRSYCYPSSAKKTGNRGKLLNRWHMVLYKIRNRPAIKSNAHLLTHCILFVWSKHRQKYKNANVRLHAIHNIIYILYYFLVDCSASCCHGKVVLIPSCQHKDQSERMNTRLFVRKYQHGSL